MNPAIIIGAGPAGLTAAYEPLTRTDIRLTVLAVALRLSAADAQRAEGRAHTDGFRRHLCAGLDDRSARGFRLPWIGAARRRRGEWSRG